MRTLVPPDPTQADIVGQLKVTEELLAAVASRMSGRSCDAEVVAMPDLGLPHNVRRIHGGFFTGAYYRWDTDVPFVPVDATVNLCGVSVFRTSAEFANETDFRTRVVASRDKLESRTGYVWNYTSGNHFITYAKADGGGEIPEGHYLVLHASAAEFKNQYNGLYPAEDNWYANHIETLFGPENRYLRFIRGQLAEQFIRTVRMLEHYQRERQRFSAGLIVGEAHLEEEILSVLHYGMPDAQSIAIGCQWMDPALPLYLLLTRPGSPLYFVRARSGGDNQVETGRGARLLTPHGLGVASSRPLDLARSPAALAIAGAEVPITGSLADANFTAIRPFDPAITLPAILAGCPGDVVGQLRPIYSYYRDGSSR